MKDNYNIKTNIPELSTEQINKHQDFDALFAQFEQSKSTEENADIGTETPIHPIAKARPLFIKYISGAAVAVAASILLIFMIRQSTGGLVPPTNQINEVLALQAPITDLAPAYEEMQVPEALKGAVLEHSSGSKIIVPAGAFVDEEGQTVKGKVDIDYRQLDDHVDMFLAGVPKEQDKHQNLQSVGMMEIKGSQNGKPVYIGTDKTLEVQLQSRVLAELPTSDLDVYVFSKQKDAWDYSTDDVVKVLDSGEVPNEVNLASLAKLQAEAEAQLADRKPVVPTKPEHVPSDMTLFDFTIDKTEYPEFAYLDQNIEFVVAKKDIVDDPFETEWNGISLKDIGANTIELELIREDEQTGAVVETRKLNIHPFIAYSAENTARYERSLDTYNAKLEQWEADVAATVAQLQAETPIVAWKTIVNTFEINRFGLWNCGRDIPLDESLRTTASMVDAQGESVDVAQLFIINQEKQLYYFTSPKDMKLDRNTENKVWALTAENELLVANIPSNQEGELIVDFESKGAIRSAEQAREVLVF